MATSYKLQGASLHEMCEHNHKVRNDVIGQNYKLLNENFGDQDTW